MSITFILLTILGLLKIGESNRQIKIDTTENRMNKHTLFLMRTLALTLILSAMAGCGRKEAITQKMDLAESLMVANPDSALAILKGIPASEIKGKEASARYALLKSIAFDKNFIDTTSFVVLQPAIDYYLKNGNPNERLRTYYYQGRIYQNGGDYDRAMQSFLRGKEYFQEASDTLTMGNLLVAQATLLYRIFRFEEFSKLNLEAANFYKAIGKLDYELHCMLNVLDGSILENNKYLADSVWTIAKELVKKNPELSSKLVQYNISYSLKYGKREDIVNLLKILEPIDSIEDIVKLNVAQAYYELGDFRNAKRVLDAVPITSSFRTSLKYLALKPDILELNGDLDGALHAYHDFYGAIDSIHTSIFSHDLLFAKTRHEMEKANLIEKQNFARIIWIILCVVFVLLIVTGFVYYRYRMGKAKTLLDIQEKQRLKIEQENLQLKIEKLENESETLKEILEKQKDLAKPIGDAIKIRIEMLNGLLASQIADNDSYAEPYEAWKEQVIQDKEEFMNTTRLAFKASHPKFIEYLEQHELTESEINYVCLYAIGLRGKEVGNYIHLKRHYHISSDVRKKLGIDEHQTNIGIYIRKIMKIL